MSIINDAVSRARAIAADSSHGYDQANRWGPDYDCSSFVISCYKAAGLALTSTYTGNMYSDFISHGFKDITNIVNLSTGAGLEPGDVLLNHANHTALYIGSGQLAQASINELGKTTGGQSGDQTGREIYERSYYNYPWDCVLRYCGESSNAAILRPGPTYEYSVKLGLLKKGMEDAQVYAAEVLLAARGYYSGELDGIFGSALAEAVEKFQGDAGLDVDAEIGGQTWTALLKTEFT